MTTLYGIVLFVHSYLRWAVLAVAIVVLLRSFRGWREARAWEPTDERWHVSWVHLLNLQFVLGLLLYVFLSPITSAFFSSAERMKHSVLRFFGVEHVMLMVMAIAIASIGRARSRKAATPPQRHRTVWSWTLGSVLLTLAGIPWPFYPAGRPMFRGIGASSPAAAMPAPASSVKVDARARSAEGCTPLYKSRCASCHGDTGRGDGPAAATLRPPPRDFADGLFASRTNTEIEYVIRDGGPPHKLSALMPAHPDLRQDELDALVGCIRILQGRPPK